MENEAVEKKYISIKEPQPEHLFYKQRINNTLMSTQTLKLPDRFINILVNLPENGMGYQIVKVILTNGKILHQQKVLNSEFLVLDKEIISEQDIDSIELEKK